MDNMQDNAPRMPFPVDTCKLKAAFGWLVRHNSYYKAMQWNEEALEEWRDPQLPCREEPIEEHQEVSQGLFETWLSSSSNPNDSHMAQPFHMASRLMSILLSNGYQEESSRWFCLLGLLAELLQKPVVRVAESISTADIAYIVHVNDTTESGEVLDHGSFRQLPFECWHDATKNIVIEICSVRLEVVDNDKVVHVSCTDDQPADTDDADRLDIVADLLSAADKEKPLNAREKKKIGRAHV